MEVTLQSLQQFLKDVEAKARDLQDILDRLDSPIAVNSDTPLEVINGTGTVLMVKGNGSTMELYGLSTDIKPTSGIIKGTTFFEMNTTNCFIYDGTIWRAI